MGEYSSFIAMMRLRIYGKWTPLWPAPKRQALKCFGGSLTIEEFRSFGGRVEPPVVSFCNEKLITTEIQTRSGSQKVETEGLKLKRPKPLGRDASKLETLLGIKKLNSTRGT
jgi:hypothetical protein